MNEIKLIVGLGNPGENYKLTRHNVGFWVLDALAKLWDAFFKEEKRFLGEFAKIKRIGNEIILLKPNTYMNDSGQSVSAVARYFKIEPEEILVIHDELDLTPGRLKLKQGGSSGGHNGLKDIDIQLGSNRYYRIRIGIGHPKDVVSTEINTHLNCLGIKLPRVSKKPTVTSYVLNKPSASDDEKIRIGIDKVLKNIDLILKGNLLKAQQELHSI